MGFLRPEAGGRRPDNGGWGQEAVGRRPDNGGWGQEAVGTATYVKTATHPEQLPR